jgi:hypothetical protein
VAKDIPAPGALPPEIIAAPKPFVYPLPGRFEARNNVKGYDVVFHVKWHIG